jgi:hypothetical protein
MKISQHCTRTQVHQRFSQNVCGCDTNLQTGYGHGGVVIDNDGSGGRGALVRFLDVIHNLINASVNVFKDTNGRYLNFSVRVYEAGK